MFIKKIRILQIIATVGIIFCAYIQVAHAQFEVSKFFIDYNFDVSARSKIDAYSIKVSPNLYFYIEKNWWDAQYGVKKEEILKNLDNLTVEFQNNIYPNLTNTFGYERIPGIDNDNRITVLFHPVKGNEVGYFRTADGYDKLQIPSSNQREMVYISADLLSSPKLKVALAHEFVHLITFNQKDINHKVEDDVWLNEARADYSSTILGYDNQVDSNNIQSRIKDFVESSSDSITEWRGTKYDYASVSLFTHYLVDHYGIKILSDSLKSNKIGIESINYVLEKYGYRERFSDIFSNWTVALILNDCSVDSKYCYLDKNLVNVKIVPNINFLPVSGNASLSVINEQKNWAGSWLKFVGANGDLKMDFSAQSDLNFVVPYITESREGKFVVKFLALAGTGKANIDIPNFLTYYKSLIIIPILQQNMAGVIGYDTAQPIKYSVYVGPTFDNQNQLTIQQLLAENEALKKQVAELQSRLGMGNNQGANCIVISGNLSIGMVNNSEVGCLQQFLKAQGVDIYPEGLITGNFANLTFKAVKKFQEKYASEILTPLGLSGATGYVGSATRAKINQILSAK